MKQYEIQNRSQKNSQSCVPLSILTNDSAHFHRYKILRYPITIAYPDNAKNELYLKYRILQLIYLYIVQYCDCYTKQKLTSNGTNIFFPSSLLPPPQPPWQFLAPYFSSLYSQLTLYRQCRLAYPYDWKGFVGVKKKTSVGLLVFNPLCVPVISLWKFAVDQRRLEHHREIIPKQSTYF